MCPVIRYSIHPTSTEGLTGARHGAKFWNAKKFHGHLVLKRFQPEHRLIFRMCCLGKEAKYRTARHFQVRESVCNKTVHEAHAHTHMYMCAGECLEYLVTLAALEEKVFIFIFIFYGTYHSLQWFHVFIC